MEAGTDRWKLAGQEYGSRLLLGTARYPNRQTMLDALQASGAEIVTVAVRRVGTEGGAENLFSCFVSMASPCFPTRPGASRRGMRS